MAVEQVLDAYYGASHITLAEKAWTRSCGGPGAGTWLLPAFHPTHVFPDGQFMRAISLRVGADILRADKIQGLICEQTLRCPSNE